jgi:NitT/TauT family transport system substrate-binding protein
MKKIFILSVLLVSVLLASCGGAAPAEQPLDILKLTISNNLSYGPLYIAEAEGYFEEFGIQMEYINFNKSSEALALLVSGDIDVYASTLNTGLLNVLSQDPNIKVVADRGHIGPGECTYQAIVVRKDLFDSGAVTSPAGLKGQVISTSKSGPSAFLLSTYLAQAGLTFEDIIINDLPNAALVDAFNNKSLAATSLPEPDLSSTLEAGNSVILVRAEDVLGLFQSGVVAFGKNLVINNPDVGARFLAAYLKGIQRYNEGKTERNLQIMVKNTGEPLDVIKKACWPNVRMDGSVDFQGVEPFQKWSVDNGFLETAVTQEQFYAPDFLEAAQGLLK